MRSDFPKLEEADLKALLCRPCPFLLILQVLAQALVPGARDLAVSGPAPGFAAAWAPVAQKTINGDLGQLKVFVGPLLESWFAGVVVLASGQYWQFSLVVCLALP